MWSRNLDKVLEHGGEDCLRTIVARVIALKLQVGWMTFFSFYYGKFQTLKCQDSKPQYNKKL